MLARVEIRVMAKPTPDLRCDFCGMLRSRARRDWSIYCAPPFKVQVHTFTGKHPSHQGDDNAKRNSH